MLCLTTNFHLFAHTLRGDQGSWESNHKSPVGETTAHPSATVSPRSINSVCWKTLPEGQPSLQPSADLRLWHNDSTEASPQSPTHEGLRGVCKEKHLKDRQTARTRFSGPTFLQLSSAILLTSCLVFLHSQASASAVRPSIERCIFPNHVRLIYHRFTQIKV